MKRTRRGIARASTFGLPAEAQGLIPPPGLLSSVGPYNQKDIDVTFGEAIEALKQGAHIQRRSWNGKNMHVYLEDGYTMAKGRGTQRTYLPVLVMFTAQGEHQPGWLARKPTCWLTIGRS